MTAHENLSTAYWLTKPEKKSLTNWESFRYQVRREITKSFQEQLPIQNFGQHIPYRNFMDMQKNLKSIYPSPRTTAPQILDKMLLPVTRFQTAPFSADCGGHSLGSTEPPAHQSGMLGHSLQWHNH